MNLNNLLKDASDSLKQIYGDDLVKVILYGSYARGDYHADSDIDILALVNYDDKTIWKYRDKLVSAMVNLDDKYSVYTSIKTNNIDHFNYWKDDMPYYKNVIKDGREINV